MNPGTAENPIQLSKTSLVTVAAREVLGVFDQASGLIAKIATQAKIAKIAKIAKVE